MTNILEAFVKDAFADTIQEEDEKAKMLKYNQVFSWLGNQNHLLTKTT
jgi:hypothetical protein